MDESIIWVFRGNLFHPRQELKKYIQVTHEKTQELLATRKCMFLLCTEDCQLICHMHLYQPVNGQYKLISHGEGSIP